jgi:hypothetical protein
MPCSSANEFKCLSQVRKPAPHPGLLMPSGVRPHSRLHILSVCVVRYGKVPPRRETLGLEAGS